MITEFPNHTTQFLDFPKSLRYAAIEDMHSKNKNAFYTNDKDKALLEPEMNQETLVQGLVPYVPSHSLH